MVRPNLGYGDVGFPSIDIVTTLNGRLKADAGAKVDESSISLDRISASDDDTVAYNASSLSIPLQLPQDCACKL